MRIFCPEGESAHYSKLDPLTNVRDMRKWKPDGIIICCRTMAFSKIYGKIGVPIVAVEEKGLGFKLPSTIPSFSVDNHSMVRTVVAEFIDRGLLSIGYCGIPDSRMTRWSRIREEEFVRYAREKSIKCSVFQSFPSEVTSEVKQKKNLLRWLGQLEKPVGVMACYDIRALQVLYACHELELSVPDDVAIIGSGNDKMLCELSVPSLSSLDQSGREIGRLAARTLYKMMSGINVDPAKTVVAHGGIVIRQSSDIWKIDDEDVRLAMQYIRHHACRGINVSNVVAAVNLSRSSLEPRFCRVIGHSIHTEIKKTQIRQVRHLLTTGKMTLEQIAGQTGFPHVQHMAALFRQHTKMNPTDYRNKNLKNE